MKTEFIKKKKKVKFFKIYINVIKSQTLNLP
jgi:hypothetical protein